MKCRVCQVPDPGNHNQHNCCRACAAFFRRTIQLNLRYRCKKVSNCKITKDNRFFCRHCRMKKCIAAGMTDPENPSFAMEFYLDNASSMQPLSEQEDTSLPTDEDVFYSVDNVVNNYDQFIDEYKERLKSILSNGSQKKTYPFGLSLHQQATVAYEAQEAKWHEFSKDNIISSYVIDVNAEFCNGFKAIQHAAEFCMEFPQFAQLPLDQKSFVMDHFASSFVYFERMFLTMQILGNDVRDTRSVYHNCHVADLRYAVVDASKISNCPADELKNMFMNEESAFINVLSEFKRLTPDSFEVMYLLLSSMWNLQYKEGINETTSKLALEIQERLSEELFFYYKFDKKVENFASRIYKLHNLFSSIDRLDELWEQDSRLAKTFDLFHFDIHYDNLKEQLA